MHRVRIGKVIDDERRHRSRVSKVFMQLRSILVDEKHDVSRAKTLTCSKAAGQCHGMFQDSRLDFDGTGTSSDCSSQALTSPCLPARNAFLFTHNPRLYHPPLRLCGESLFARLKWLLCRFFLTQACLVLFWQAGEYP
jgi:hypothetical protein